MMVSASVSPDNVGLSWQFVLLPRSNAESHAQSRARPGCNLAGATSVVALLGHLPSMYCGPAFVPVPCPSLRAVGGLG